MLSHNCTKNRCKQLCDTAWLVIACFETTTYDTGSLLHMPQKIAEAFAQGMLDEASCPQMMPWPIFDIHQLIASWPEAPCCFRQIKDVVEIGPEHAEVYSLNRVSKQHASDVRS